MKVISTVDVIIRKDRVSELIGKVEIEITQTDKDDVNQIYYFETNDILVCENGDRLPIIQIESNRQTKNYSKTYAEYDAEKTQLSQLFPTELTGSEADDYWLQCGLLYSLMTDPIYGLTCEIEIGTGVVTGDWERL